VIGHVSQEGRSGGIEMKPTSVCHRDLRIVGFALIMDESCLCVSFEYLDVLNFEWSNNFDARAILEISSDGKLQAVRPTGGLGKTHRVAGSLCLPDKLVLAPGGASVRSL
jgi:hypothetical protein